jgi:hypothetical protein
MKPISITSHNHAVKSTMMAMTPGTIDADVVVKAKP